MCPGGGNAQASGGVVSSVNGSVTLAAGSTLSFNRADASARGASGSHATAQAAALSAHLFLDP
eukprot:SAG25_NODE_6716_length_535_cov_1.775229_1_plen_62_part_01